MNLLTQHTLSVHEKQCFQCTFENCTKTVATPSGMKSHLKRHTALKTKMCEKCSKMFYNESKVKAHMLTHYENKFHCDICRKSLIGISQN